VSSNTVDLDFGDGSYTFALPLPQIAELQRKTGAGIGALFARVIKGAYQVRGEVQLDPGSAQFYALDVIETIRHGLIGGGKGMVNGEETKVDPQLANRLVDTYVLGYPLADSWSKAASILGACIVGYDPPKKDPPANERAPAKPRRKKAGSTTA
jgi:hypothetical protein